MTKYFIIIFFACFHLVNAQNVVSIEQTSIGSTSNTYYKDVNNLLNFFEGTWLYTSGTSQLKIVIQKKTNYYDSAYNIHVDYLIGEYQYLQNGAEIINTLNDLNNQNLGLFDHNVFGNNIIFKKIAEVDSQGPTLVVAIEFRDKVGRPYVETNANLQFDHNNPNQLKFVLRDDHNIIPYQGAPMDFKVPFGDYILIKQ